MVQIGIMAGLLATGQRQLRVTRKTRRHLAVDDLVRLTRVQRVVRSLERYRKSDNRLAFVEAFMDDVQTNPRHRVYQRLRSALKPFSNRFALPFPVDVGIVAIHAWNASPARMSAVV